MSRNRESWLLSLALPHIPFLSLAKSFPFTFPPSLYFRREKTKPLLLQSARNLLWPVTVQNIAAARGCKTPSVQEPRCSHRPQQSLALPVLTFREAQSL